MTDLEDALVATMIGSLSQGLHLYAVAAGEHGWKPDLPDVLRVWRAGSILRMGLLDEIAGRLEGARAHRTRFRSVISPAMSPPSCPRGAGPPVRRSRPGYRDRLRRSGADLRFLHLTGDAGLIRQRMDNRSDHFMSAGLLDSQLAILEPARPDEDLYPARPDEDLYEVDISGTVGDLAKAAIRSLTGLSVPAG